MKRVITYGTFDLLHPGHINLLRRAKDLGDELYVGLSTDEFNQMKGKTAVLKYEQRKTVLEAIRYVDHVFPESDWEQKTSDIKKYGILCFVMGDDWKGKFDFLKDYCTVVNQPRTPDITTTDIKQKIQINNGKSKLHYTS